MWGTDAKYLFKNLLGFPALVRPRSFELLKIIFMVGDRWNKPVGGEVVGKDGEVYHCERFARESEGKSVKIFELFNTTLVSPLITSVYDR